MQLKRARSEQVTWLRYNIGNIRGMMTPCHGHALPGAVADNVGVMSG